MYEEKDDKMESRRGETNSLQAIDTSRYLLVDAITTTLSFVVRRPSHSCHVSDTTHTTRNTQNTAVINAKVVKEI